MVLERERVFLLSRDVLLAWFSAGTVAKMGCIEVGRDLPKQAWIPGSSMVLGNPESQSQSCTLCVSSRRSIKKKARPVFASRGSLFRRVQTWPVSAVDKSSNKLSCCLINTAFATRRRNENRGAAEKTFDSKVK